MVGVLPDGDATEEAAEFKAAAQAMRDDFDFGLVTDASLVAEAKGCDLYAVPLNIVLAACRWQCPACCTLVRRYT